MSDRVSFVNVVRVEIGEQILRKLIADPRGLVIVLKEQPVEIRLTLDEEMRKVLVVTLPEKSTSPIVRKLSKKKKKV